ncbi:hypothetical protein ACHAXR_001019 [Thalassiosira sp. AJA248-18]
MGNTAGKHTNKDIDTSFHDLSGHGNLSEREASSAWYRYGVAVTDVYDVVEVLGQGHMGEVFTVRRKTTGHHTNLTRERLRESEADLKSMLKKEQFNEHQASGAAGADGEMSTSKRGRKASFSSPGRKSSNAGGGVSGRPSLGGKAKSSRPSITGAIHKTKKVMKKVAKGDKGGIVLDEDANSNLAPFIKSNDDYESQHEPSKNTTATPRKSCIKEEGKFSSSRSNAEREDVLSNSMRNDSSGSFIRSGTYDSPTDIEKAMKGVHFQRTFAVKTILTSRINKDQLQELVNEIMIMRKLDHPYVLKLYEVYHVKRKFALAWEARISIALVLFIISILTKEIILN